MVDEMDENRSSSPATSNSKNLELEDDIQFFFPITKGPGFRSTSIPSLVPDESLRPSNSNWNFRHFVKHSFEMFLESTVEDIIEQALMLEKYEILDRQFEGFLLTLKNLTTSEDAEAIFIIADSLLKGALNVDLNDTVVLLNILSVYLKRSIQVRNKTVLRSLLKARIRDLVSPKNSSQSTSYPESTITVADIRKEREAELQEEANQSKAAVIAAILFRNDHIPQSFLVSIINNLFKEMTVRGFRTICQMLQAIRSFIFQFVDEAKELDEDFLLKVYSHLNNYLNQLTRKRLVSKCDLESLQNILTSTIEGSHHEKEIDFGDHGPGQGDIQDSNDCCSEYSGDTEVPPPEFSEVDGYSSQAEVDKDLAPQHPEFSESDGCSSETEVDQDVALYDLPVLRFFKILD